MILLFKIRYNTNDFFNHSIILIFKGNKYLLSFSHQFNKYEENILVELGGKC